MTRSRCRHEAAEHDHGADTSAAEHDHGADGATMAADHDHAGGALDVEALHDLDDELAIGKLDATAQRAVVADYIARVEEMKPAAGSPEAELLKLLRDLDAARPPAIWPRPPRWLRRPTTPPTSWAPPSPEGLSIQRGGMPSGTQSVDTASRQASSAGGEHGQGPPRNTWPAPPARPGPAAAGSATVRPTVHNGIERRQHRILAHSAEQAGDAAHQHRHLRPPCRDGRAVRSTRRTAGPRDDPPGVHNHHPARPARRQVEVTSHHATATSAQNSATALIPTKPLLAPGAHRGPALRRGGLTPGEWSEPGAAPHPPGCVDRSRGV